jgi:hypothetical protein
MSRLIRLLCLFFMLSACSPAPVEEIGALPTLVEFPTSTDTPPPTATYTESATPTETTSATLTNTATPSETLTATVTDIPTFTSNATSSTTPTFTPSATITDTSTAAITNTARATVTVQPSPIRTQSASDILGARIAAIDGVREILLTSVLSQNGTGLPLVYFEIIVTDGNNNEAMAQRIFQETSAALATGRYADFGMILDDCNSVIAFNFDFEDDVWRRTPMSVDSAC